MSQSNPLHPKSSDLKHFSEQENSVDTMISTESGEEKPKEMESGQSEGDNKDICPECGRQNPTVDELCAYCGGPYVEDFCCSGCGRLL
jgi:hypothetical protein